MKNTERLEVQVNFQTNNSSLILTSDQSHSAQTPFLTSAPSSLHQQTTKKSLNQIHQIYNQIHSTINDMDFKVQHVIKKHQAQFLFAYRNHIKKIKKQLSQIKYKSEEQEKMFSANDRIQYLEQQLAIFRQQTMKIYNKLDQKNVEIDILKIKVKDLERQTIHATSELKEQIKKNKFQEMNYVNMVEKIQTLQSQVQRKNKEIQRLNEKLIYNTADESMKLGYSANNMKIPVIDQMKRLEYSKTSPLKTVRKSPQRSFNTSALGTSAQFYIKSPQSPRIYETDLKQWFLQCIKTVKREIAQRNNNQKFLELTNISSIQQFMMIDKLRLLEIFLQNEKLLTYMYERIFPDRLSNLRQKLSSSRQQNLTDSKKQPLILTQREERISSFNQEILTDRYRTQNKISYLPKVGRVSQNRTKISEKSGWKGNLILKDGKLNISIQ